MIRTLISAEQARALGLPFAFSEIMQLTIQVLSTIASGVYFSSNILNTEFGTCAIPAQLTRKQEVLDTT